MEREEAVKVHSLKVLNLHGLYNYDISFNDDLTIIYGENGAGKTMILHILSNILEGDFQRFFYIDFTYIEVATNSINISILKRDENSIDIDFGDLNTSISQGSESSSADAIRDIAWRYFRSPPIYLPAFRVILEAASRNYLNSDSEIHKSQVDQLRNIEIRRIRAQEANDASLANFRDEVYIYGTEPLAKNSVKTLLCRNWFGPFVPYIRMPSLAEISESLYDDFRRGQLEVSRFDRSSVMDFVESTVSILARVDSDKYTKSQLLDIERRINEKINRARSFSRESSQIYMRIDPIIASLRAVGDLEGGQSKIGTLLKSYESLLDKQLESQEVAFRDLNKFQEAVNIFLKHKTIEVMNLENSARLRVKKFVKINSEMFGFNILSSGERHILTLLYSVSSINESNGVLMIDEPEISMHVAWQRKFASRLRESGAIRQTIVCTHSPEIAAEFRDKLVKLSAKR